MGLYRRCEIRGRGPDRPAAPISPARSKKAGALVVVAGLIAAAAGCGGSKYASAAAGAAVGVAAAGIYRATTGGCWASCQPGMGCDEASGVCVALPCAGTCPSESRCVMKEGRETCVRGQRDTATSDTSGAREPEPEGEPDPCRGLCVSSERCVVEAGVADCVASPGSPE